MSQNPLIPAKPAEITLDTLPQLFAHHRARFGGWSMTQTPPENDPQNQPGGGQDDPPERPDGISEQEWEALGDPGRAAIVREREARQAAERALAASRARPAPPKPKSDPPKPEDKNKPGDQPKNDAPDFEALIQKAVEAAVKPFTEREERRQVEEAANKVRQAVIDAAKPRLHDATDALTGIDLASVVDDSGKADDAKVKQALDDLVKRKPHLAKSTERTAPPGIGGGGPAGATDAEKVKAVLADMQRATGIPTPQSSNTGN